MSTEAVDLDALAARIARELARADQVGFSARPSPTSVQAPVPASPSSGAPSGVRYVREGARIAEFIDHTVLKAETTRSEIEQLCAEAVEHQFAAVCVNPVWVPLCASKLQGSRVALATVVGVLIEVPVMLSVCSFCNRTRHWFPDAEAASPV